MAQWSKRVRKTLSAYWFDTTLLILAVGAPVLSALGAPMLSALLSSDTGEAHWFQRSGSLTVLFAVILEFWTTTIVKDARDAAWAAAKRRSWAGTAVLGQLPTPRKVIALIALVLMVLGTIIWGYGDLIISEFLVP